MTRITFSSIARKIFNDGTWLHPRVGANAGSSTDILSAWFIIIAIEVAAAFRVAFPRAAYPHFSFALNMVGDRTPLANTGLTFVLVGAGIAVVACLQFLLGRAVAVRDGHVPAGTINA